MNIEEYRKLNSIVEEYKDNEIYNCELELKARNILYENNVEFSGNAIYMLEHWIDDQILEYDDE